MKIMDAGHKFELNAYDGNKIVGTVPLVFTKRIGAAYPGNVDSYPGTILQECWRAEIARLKYLNDQEWCSENQVVIKNLRENILLLERRAARRHGRALLPVSVQEIETLPTCALCGHILCEGGCR